MNETMVTLQGWLGGDVRSRAGRRRAGRQLPGGLHAAALNRRPASGYDGHTQWYTVNAWRALAEHCAARCAAATRSWSTAG